MYFKNHFTFKTPPEEDSDLKARVKYYANNIGVSPKIQIQEILNSNKTKDLS